MGNVAASTTRPWDKRFLDLLERDPETLTRMTHAQYATLGGMEGSEIIMWLIMRGALSARVRCVHQSYYLPSMTAIATAVYENEGDPMEKVDAARHRDSMERQLRGADLLDGTYPYTLERSAKGFRVNRFLHTLVEPENRARFLADEEAAFLDSGLSDEESDLIRTRDWRGLIHYGAIFFVLEKLGAVLGMSNVDIYAAMRGESVDAFQATRNAALTYSVASPT